MDHNSIIAIIDHNIYTDLSVQKYKLVTNLHREVHIRHTSTYW